MILGSFARLFSVVGVTLMIVLSALVPLGDGAAAAADPVATQIVNIATAECYGWSANCTFTLNAAEQRAIVIGGGAAASGALSTACGPGAIGCFAAATAVGAAVAGVISGDIRDECLFLVRTSTLGDLGMAGIIVIEERQVCPPEI